MAPVRSRAAVRTTSPTPVRSPAASSWSRIRWGSGFSATARSSQNGGNPSRWSGQPPEQVVDRPPRRTGEVVAADLLPPDPGQQLRHPSRRGHQLLECGPGALHLDELAEWYDGEAVRRRLQ